MTSSTPQPLGNRRDQYGQLFVHEGRLLRGIRAGHAEFYGGLLALPAIREAIANGLLIGAQKVDATLDHYPLVIEHPRIPFVTYPFEWTPSMFKAATLCLLRLNQHLMRHGLCLNDGHPWNILFKGPHPIFVDFTSIVALCGGRWEAAAEFEIWCIRPLELMAKGYADLSRSLLSHTLNFPSENFPAAMLRSPAKRGPLGKLTAPLELFAEKIRRHVRHRLARGDTSLGAEGVARLISRVEKLNVIPPVDSWTDYYSTRIDSNTYTGRLEEFDTIRKASAKTRAVEEILTHIQPRTVLDIGCNRGIYSQLAAMKGASVIGIDQEDAVLDLMFHDSARLGTEVTPLYVDVLAPLEAVGYKEMPPPRAGERLRADCVLALAVIHHLVFTQEQQSFAHVVRALANYTNRHLILEFIPTTDEVYQRLLHKRSAEYRSRFDWYGYAPLRAELALHFARVEDHPSFPEGRVLLLCEKA